MKRKLTYLGVVVLTGVAALVISGTRVKGENTGNGAPSGAHFDLNLIGKEHAIPPENSGGDVIFVLEDGTSDIFLFPGPFAVLDDNATDANGGAFQLPAPVNGSFTYTVWIRAVGKPGPGVMGTITPCATITLTGGGPIPSAR